MKVTILFSLIVLMLVGMASYYAFQTTNSLMAIERERELRWIMYEVQSNLRRKAILDLPSEIRGMSYELWIKDGKLYGKCGNIITSIKLETPPDVVLDESSFSGGKIVVERYEAHGKMHIRLYPFSSQPF